MKASAATAKPTAVLDAGQRNAEIARRTSLGRDAGLGRSALGDPAG
jgi:hypothetical protein